MWALSIRRLVPPPARLGEFSPLLVSLVVTMISVQVLEAHRLASSILISIVLLTGILAVRRERHVLVATLVLVIPELTTRWMSELFDSTQSLATVVAQSLLAIYLLFIAVVVLLAVLGHEKVTPQTVGGAVCVYLLIAFVFACLYGILEFSVPGSLDFSGTRIGVNNTSMANTAFPRLLYFSFVTLTTLGYGDIVPVSGAARSLTISETLAGQLFLAAFIARLVGSMIASRRSSN